MNGRELSLAVVGIAYPNRDGGNRLFEVMLCTPGEPVSLVREPRNPADPSAVAVFSARGIQIGYLSAERCGLIGASMARGAKVRAIFQAAGRTNVVIRVSLDGAEPMLPTRILEREPIPADDPGDFYPDDIPPDAIWGA